MPDGSTTGIIQGHQRFRLEGITSKDPFLRGQVQLLSEGLPERGKGKDKEFDALVSTIQDMSLKMLHVANVDVPKEILVTLRKNKNPLIKSILHRPASLPPHPSNRNCWRSTTSETEAIAYFICCTRSFKCLNSKLPSK